MENSGTEEKELKAFSDRLNEQQKTLDVRESELDQKTDNLAHERDLFERTKATFEKEREDFRKTVQENAEKNETDRAEIEKRREELILLEEKAKQGFAEKQNEAFHETIEKRIRELDLREKDLNDLADKVAKDLAAARKLEGDLAKKELDLVEREQKANAGFADQATALAAEAKRQSDANQQEANRLKAWETSLAADKDALETEKAAIHQREKAVADAERKRDAGYVEERRTFETEMETERKRRLAELEQEIADIRKSRLDEIVKACDAERSKLRGDAEEEAKRIHDDVIAERKAWIAEKATQENELKTWRQNNETKSAELSAKEDCLNGKEQNLRETERQNEAIMADKDRQIGLVRQSIEDTVAARIAEYKAEMEAKITRLEEAGERLRGTVQKQEKLLLAFDHLKRQLGDKDPAEIIRDLNSKTDELSRLREELATRPTDEMRDRYEQMKNENERLSAENNELKEKVKSDREAVAEVDQLRIQNEDYKEENNRLTQKNETLTKEANNLQEELNRRLSAFERPSEVVARYKEIELPHIPADEVKPPVKYDSLDELKWLDGIYRKCDDYGLHFPMRILKAFHTAIKTAEWSPLTVLAGVSGTGKSELPRLYSHFGGMLFMPLSVQPNWDSQESMLGFFNSIDNKFDAQPVLRFLAQSQQPPNETYEKRIARWREMAGSALNLDPDKQKELIEELKDTKYPGLNNSMCMVLLDEMNLAHPELYFAEFLSKLELRRGMKGSDVPRLPVKIGAGLPPYLLPLGRNVLWIGTMNQDETTKSLSDKVLDRSIIISFPRPTKLKRRQVLTALDETNRGAALSKKNYFQWLAQKSEFSDSQVEPFKDFVQRMNEALGVAGRAIGHRVWQSVEYYMANYPDVRVALANDDDGKLFSSMHTAFEDQLVQKIMPKLRGIDTRGKTKTDCLDRILGLLNEGIKDKPFNLENDFKLACELGHGQFIWQSAEYLREDSEEEPAGDSDSDSEEPVTNEKKRKQSRKD